MYITNSFYFFVCFVDVVLLQVTGEIETSFKVDWSFAREDEVNIRRFKIRWCENPSCRMFARRRRFVRQAETVHWIERYRSPSSRRSFTLTVHDSPVYAFQVVAEALSEDVPEPSLQVDSNGKTKRMNMTHRYRDILLPVTLVKSLGLKLIAYNFCFHDIDF